MFFPPCGPDSAPVITPPAMSNESVSSDESHLISFLNHAFQLLHLTGSHCTQWIINDVTQQHTHTHTLFMATKACATPQLWFIFHIKSERNKISRSRRGAFGTSFEYFSTLLQSCSDRSLVCGPLFSRRASVRDLLCLRGGHAGAVPQLDAGRRCCRRGPLLQILHIRVLGLRRLQIHCHVISRSAFHVWGNTPPTLHPPAISI